MAKLITVVPEVVLDVVLDELKARDLLVDGFDEVFGSVSFDEVVAKLMGVSVTRPVEVQR
jgi:hypothetical protein